MTVSTDNFDDIRPYRDDEQTLVHNIITELRLSGELLEEGEIEPISERRKHHEGQIE